MTNRKVTLSIDSSTYDRFRQHCENNAIMLSKKIELFMKELMGEGKGDVKRKGK